MNLTFIRHGMTDGNKEKRYIGKTDEPLCDAGIRQLAGRSYPCCDVIIASPMRRCVETARLLYPQKEIHKIRDFRECDFGIFEGKNYQELSENRAYQEWIESGGRLPFPGGESREEFQKRSLLAFAESLSLIPEQAEAVYVVHGGTIMAILEAYVRPKRDYYDFQVPNGGGYRTTFDGTEMVILEKL